MNSVRISAEKTEQFFLQEFLPEFILSGDEN